MENQRITPLTESGLLTAITVIMALMAVYLPVMGIVAALFWAVPLILLVVRHGFRLGLMAVLAAGIIMALLIEPLLSLRMTISFAPTGLALGYGFRRGWSGVRVFSVALIASILAKVAALALIFAVTAVNPLAMQVDGMKESFEASFQLYETLGMEQSVIDEAKGQVSEGIAMIQILMPLIVAITGLLDTVVNYIVAGRIMSRLGISVSQFPPFREWRLPQVFLYLMGFALVGMYWGGSREIQLLYEISLNANILALLAGLVQGLSLVTYVAHRYRISMFLRILVFFLILVNGMLLQIIAFTGLFDMAFDYRRRFGGVR